MINIKLRFFTKILMCIFKNNFLSFNYFLFIIIFHIYAKNNEITPFKLFEEYDNNKAFIRPAYIVPESSHFKIERKNFFKINKENSVNELEKNINYYFSSPKTKNYPIIILITGTLLVEELKNSWSIIDLHRFYLEELHTKNLGVLTVERTGCTDIKYDKKIYYDHYSINQRILDHEEVIENLKKQPPAGWNGKIIFWGISEGAILAQQLAQKYKDDTLLLILWASFLNTNKKDYETFFLDDINNQIKKLVFAYKENTSFFEYSFTYSYIYFEYLKEKFFQAFSKKTRFQKILEIWCNKHFAFISKIKKNDWLYFIDYIKNNNFIDETINSILGFPPLFWKGLFSLGSFSLEAVNFPILIIAGEKDSIVTKYVKNNDRLKNSFIETHVLPNTEHQIRKNPESLKLTLEKIKTVL